MRVISTTQEQTATCPRCESAVGYYPADVRDVRRFVPGADDAQGHYEDRRILSCPVCFAPITVEGT